MARDMKYLAVAMRQYAGQVLTGTDRVVSSVAGAVLVEVVNGTPVDTGEARSNWIVTIGNQTTARRPPYSPYPKYSGPKINETANAEQTIAAGLQVIGLFGLTNLGNGGNKILATVSGDAGQITFSVGSSKTIYIQNNVDYIGDLNDGTSKQAPAMFVQKATLIGLSKITGGQAQVI